MGRNWDGVEKKGQPSGKTGLRQNIYGLREKLGYWAKKCQSKQDIKEFSFEVVMNNPCLSHKIVQIAFGI
jgi:hypothetical protein